MSAFSLALAWEIIQMAGAVAGIVAAGIVVPERFKAWRLRRHIKGALKGEPKRGHHYSYWGETDGC